MPRYALITTLDNVWIARGDDLKPILERRADLTASGVPSAIVEVLAWEGEPDPPRHKNVLVGRRFCVHCHWDWQDLAPTSDRVACPDCGLAEPDLYWGEPGPAFRNEDD